MMKSPEGKAMSSYVEANPAVIQTWKKVSEAAERLLAEEGTPTSFVFISPSKRRPKRASLTRVEPTAAAAAPFKAFLSDWERKYDVNNLVRFLLYFSSRILRSKYDIFNIYFSGQLL